MQIPAYDSPTLEAYQASGTIKGHRSELDHQSAEACLQSYKDEFSRWQSLDESEADLFKGRPGEVRIASSAGSGYTEASFSGDVHSGRLAVAQNDPQTHYGFSSYAHTCFKPQSVENLSLQSIYVFRADGERYDFSRDLSYFPMSFSTTGTVFFTVSVWGSESERSDFSVRRFILLPLTISCIR